MPKRFTQQSAATASPIAQINSNYLADEQTLVAALAEVADPGESAREKIRETAASLVITLALNSLSRRIVRRYRQEYE